jgi:hypothetical protein
MRFIILELLAIWRDAGVAILDMLCRRAGRSYEHSMLVRAPRDIVWAVASAQNITLDGSPPIIIKALPSPEQGVEMLQVRTGELSYRIGLRELERREGEGEMHAIVPEHTDHLAMMTGVTVSGFKLIDAPGGTWLTMLQECGRMRLAARITTPMALRLMGRRIATASEQAAVMSRPRGSAMQARTPVAAR